MVDPSRHADESRNVVESILRHIPGFKGYLEKEYRRESDHLTRTWVADQLQQCKVQLDNFQRALLDSGNIDALPMCERLRTRIDTLESRIRGAVRGYSGFFDYVKVNEDTLDEVCDHDLVLIDDAQELFEIISSLGASSANPAEALSGVQQRIEEMHRRFDGRSEILEGLN